MVVTLDGRLCCENRGHMLELSIYKQISKIPCVRNIFHESDLKRMYGWAAASVDFLLEFDAGIVPIQCKFRNTRRREDNSITNFVKSIKYVSDMHGRPVLFGLWISRLEPFDDNKEKLRNHKIDTVSKFGSIEELSAVAYHKLVNQIAIAS